VPRSLLVTLLALAAALSSCARHPTSPPSATTAPEAVSPTAALQAFQWRVLNREPDGIAGLVAEDFRLGLVDLDSTGTPPVDTTRASVERRTGFLAAWRNLLVGAPARPPAAHVLLDLDPNFVAIGDMRPGKDPRVHQDVSTACEFQVIGDEGNLYQSHALLRFHLVRGDSVAIPPDQGSLGAARDSTRWWIEGVDDESLPGPANPQPTHAVRFAELLALYR